MKKFVSAVVVVLLISSAGSAYSMCVYNRTEQMMHVAFCDYSKGGGFCDQWYISKSDHKCKTGRDGEVRVYKSGAMKCLTEVDKHGWVNITFEDNKKYILLKSYRENGSVRHSCSSEW